MTAADRDEFRWELAADAVYDPTDDQPSDPEPHHGLSGPLADDVAYFWGLDNTGIRSLTDRIKGDQP